MGVAVMNRESKPVAAPMPDTKPLPADNLKPISSETRTYEIVPGDGFFLIAKKVYPNYVHRVSEASLDLMYAAEEIAKANGMTLQSVIHPGNKLNIPALPEYMPDNEAGPQPTPTAAPGAPVSDLSQEIGSTPTRSHLPPKRGSYT